MTMDFKSDGGKISEPVTDAGGSPAPVWWDNHRWGPERKTGAPLICPMVNAKNPLDTIAPAVAVCDISHYQPNLNWANLAKHFRGAIIKATDGTGSKSSTYDAQRAAAAKHGVITGSYHFARFGGLSPKDEAAHFLKVTGGVRVGELPLAMDCEWDRYNPRYNDSSETMDDAAAAEVLELCERIEEATKLTPFLYCSWPFFKGFKNPERFFRFHPWNPAYWRASRAEITGPKVPLPWSKCAMWQWTDNHPDAKSITGDGNLDANWFNGTFAQFDALRRKA
jgi:lysozyme